RERLETFQIELEKYIAEKNQWPNGTLAQNKKQNPIMWWIAEDYTELSDFAQRILSIPTSLNK
ncbi:unnamed protein product, partial [Aphanomyces euteiches]